MAECMYPRAHEIEFGTWLKSHKTCYDKAYSELQAHLKAAKQATSAETTPKKQKESSPVTDLEVLNVVSQMGKLSEALVKFPSLIAK